MKHTLLALGLLAQSVAAETADELAKRVIEENASPTINLGAPNRIDENALARVAAINSQAFLESVMMSDQVSERVRLSFAIRVLNERIRNGALIKKHVEIQGNDSKIETVSREPLSAEDKEECHRKISILAKRVSVLPVESKKPNKSE